MFTEPLKDQKCKEKVSQVEFTCKYTKHNAKLRWYKNKLEIFHGHKYNFLNEDGEFKVRVRASWRSSTVTSTTSSTKTASSRYV